MQSLKRDEIYLLFFFIFFQFLKIEVGAKKKKRKKKDCYDFITKHEKKNVNDYIIPIELFIIYLK